MAGPGRVRGPAAVGGPVTSERPATVREHRAVEGPATVREHRAVEGPMTVRGVTAMARSATVTGPAGVEGPTASEELTTVRGLAAVEGPAASGEAGGGSSLSGTEKEKLREKLALLRREYSETVSRLRRARRAERARSHGQGTAVEGGRREQSLAGSGDNLSLSADKHETSQLLTKTCSDLDTEKQTSVLVSLQESPQEELCCGIVRPAPEEKRAQSCRGLMKLRRRTKALALEGREAVSDVHPTSTGEVVKKQLVRAGEVRSPVFRRSSLSSTEENTHRASRAALAQREESSFTPPEAALEAVQDMLEDSIPPEVPEVSLGGLRDSSHVWQPESPSAVATADNPEPAELPSENSDSEFTSGARGEDSSGARKQMDSESVCGDQGEVQRLLDVMSEDEVLPADGSSTVTDESKSHRGDHSESHPFPTDPALGNIEEVLENQQLEVQPRAPQAEEEPAAGGALGSCTVVEGLLFPVEYYVRTTRRMASCQRKVNLSAVILSQLGRSKKAHRSKGKQKDANSDQASPGSAENDVKSGIRLFPSPGAENGPANSSSPQRSLPASSGSSTSLGSASQSSTTSAQRAQRPSQGRQKGRRRSGCRPSARQVPQQLTEGLASLTPGESSSLLPGEAQKENCEADLEKPSPGESRRGCSYPAGSEAAAALSLPAVDSDTCGSLFSPSLQWLLPTLAVTDFHLPDEEFGPLKLEKLESSPLKELEDFVPSVLGDGVAAEGAHKGNPEEQPLKSDLLSPFKHEMPRLPPGESPAARKELSSYQLLLTPLGTVLAGAPTQPGSQIASSLFPVVGASPAVLPPAHSQLFPSTPSAAPASLQSSRGAPAPHRDEGECRDSAFPLHLGSCGAGAAGKEEEQGTGFALEAGRGPSPASGEAVALEKHQQSGSEEQSSCRASEQKTDGAEQLPPVLPDGLREESLQLVSELKDSSSSCAVDVSTMWWEAAGCRELCVLTACESSVSLWKPLPSDCWSKVHTWQLAEIPVIQLLPLPDTCNLVCVALGELEIGEIRLLLYSPEAGSFKQSLVRAGTIKAALGLRDRRLVSSSRAGQEQQVELVSLSERGRSKDGQTLMPPEETVLAFAEVEGMRDALVGSTAENSVVIWNLKTGQLLRKMHVGYSYPASICHRACAHSGLLFVVVSHPHAEESECCGTPAFRLLAFNPSTARSRGVLSFSLPPGHTGRCLEGDVKDTLAAAVLTSGTVAVWDLLLGHCTALLPPGPAGSWALTRWAASSSTCLLAGQRDGTVCLYRYRQPRLGLA